MTTSDHEGRRYFGRLLANALKARAMKQEDLARLMGTTQSSVSGWINGKYEPPAGTVFRMERLLEVDPGLLSRPLGYLPLEGPQATVGVPTAIAQASVLDEDEKAVLISLYELLSGRHQRSTTPIRSGKATAGPRQALGSSPGPKHQPAPASGQRTAAGGR
jgi:transcriptional regulator with XRE-family HTH domain